MSKNKKSRAAGGNPAGESGAEQLTLDYSQCSTNVPTRQAQLKTLDRAMAAAHQAGDSDAWVTAFQSWLDTFCGVSDE